MTDPRVNELENRTTKNSLKRTEEKIWKKIKEDAVICEIISKGMTYMWVDSKKENKAGKNWLKSYLKKLWQKILKYGGTYKF